MSSARHPGPGQVLPVDWLISPSQKLCLPSTTNPGLVNTLLPTGIPQLASGRLPKPGCRRLAGNVPVIGFRGNLHSLQDAEIFIGRSLCNQYPVQLEATSLLDDPGSRGPKVLLIDASPSRPSTCFRMPCRGDTPLLLTVSRGCPHHPGPQRPGTELVSSGLACQSAQLSLAHPQ